jgi:hypothetical protein
VLREIGLARPTPRRMAFWARIVTVFSYFVRRRSCTTPSLDRVQPRAPTAEFVAAVLSAAERAAAKNIHSG